MKVLFFYNSLPAFVYGLSGSSVFLQQQLAQELGLAVDDHGNDDIIETPPSVVDAAAAAADTTTETNYAAVSAQESTAEVVSNNETIADSSTAVQDQSAVPATPEFVPVIPAAQNDTAMAESALPVVQNVSTDTAVATETVAAAETETETTNTTGGVVNGSGAAEQVVNPHIANVMAIPGEEVVESVCAVQPLPNTILLTPMNCGYINAYFKQIQTSRYGQWTSTSGDYMLSWKQQVLSASPRSLYIIDAFGNPIITAEEYMDNKNTFLIADCNDEGLFTLSTAGTTADTASVTVRDLNNTVLFSTVNTGKNQFTIRTAGNYSLADMLPVENATFKVMDQETGLPVFASGPDAEHCFLNQYQLSVSNNGNLSSSSLNDTVMSSIFDEKGRWVLALSAQMLALHQADIRYGGALWDIPNLIMVVNVFLLVIMAALYCMCFYGYMSMVLGNRKRSYGEVLYMESQSGGYENTAKMFSTLKRSGWFDSGDPVLSEPKFVTELGHEFDESAKLEPQDTRPTFKNRLKTAASAVHRIIMGPITRQPPAAGHAAAAAAMSSSQVRSEHTESDQLLTPSREPRKFPYKCKQCQTVLIPGQIYCSACGNCQQVTPSPPRNGGPSSHRTVRPSPDSVRTSDGSCPRCGEPGSVKDRFCGVCGFDKNPFNTSFLDDRSLHDGVVQPSPVPSVPFETTPDLSPATVLPDHYPDQDSDVYTLSPAATAAAVPRLVSNSSNAKASAQSSAIVGAHQKDDDDDDSVYEIGK